MKKSQVLAALALAFALGVVAPISASAKVIIDGSYKDLDEYNTAFAKTDAAAMALGDCTEGSKNLLASYVNLYGTVEGAATAVKNAEDAYAGAEDTARGGMVTVLQGNAFKTAINAAGVVADNAAWTNYNGSEVNAYTTYSALLGYAQGLANALQNEYTTTQQANALDGNVVINNDAKTAADLLVAGTVAAPTGAIPTAMGAVAGAKTTLDGVYDAQRDAINAVLAAAPFSQVTSGNTTYAQAVAAAKAMPKYNNFVKVIKQRNIVYGMNSTEAGALTYTVTQAFEALNALNEDIANFCDTELSGEVVAPAPVEDTNALKPGNTGVVAGADATAKATVSIMAAIASVATAAFVAIRKIAAGKKA